MVSTENYSEMQKGRIDYVPPQPDVLKGALLHDVQPAQMPQPWRGACMPRMYEMTHDPAILRTTTSRPHVGTTSGAGCPCMLMLDSDGSQWSPMAVSGHKHGVQLDHAASLILPGAFKAVNGQAAQPADARVADAFPQLTRVPHVTLQATGGPLAAAPGADRSLNVGVVLSGGQAPGACSAAAAAHAGSRTRGNSAGS